MASYLYVGVTPEELHERVVGEVWKRWGEREPVLRSFGSLLDSAWLDGPDRDQGLGALVRLAAKDGGDGELAAIAVCHRMRPAVVRAIQEFGPDDDAEAIFVGALWESIRAFPWKRRSRAYASHLIHDTRLRVLRFQSTRRHQHDRFQCVFVGSDDLLDWARSSVGVGYTDLEVTDSVTELFELLEWAGGSGVLVDHDVALLRDLLAASYSVSDQDTPWTARGACSQAAVHWLAERKGMSERTLRRRRDRAIQRLRRAAPAYLSDVA